MNNTSMSVMVIWIIFFLTISLGSYGFSLVADSECEKQIHMLRAIFFLLFAMFLFFVFHFNYVGL